MTCSLSTKPIHERTRCAPHRSIKGTSHPLNKSELSPCFEILHAAMMNDSLPFVMAILFFTAPARIGTASPRARYEINGDTPSVRRLWRWPDGSLNMVAFSARTWFLLHGREHMPQEHRWRPSAGGRHGNLVQRGLPQVLPDVPRRPVQSPGLNGASAVPERRQNERPAVLDGEVFYFQFPGRTRRGELSQPYRLRTKPPGFRPVAVLRERG